MTALTLEMPRNLTVPEVAEILRISRPTAYRMVQRGEIPSFKVGRKPLVKETELAAWINRQTSAVVAQ